MFITSINIAREGYYGAGYGKPDFTKPFRTKIEVQGVSGKVELVLSEDLSRRVVEIIADEVISASRATAEAMTAEALNVTALAAPEPA